MVLVYVLISVFLLWKDINKKDEKLILVSQCLMVISLLFELNYVLEWDLINPKKILTFIYEPLANVVFNIEYSCR
jgi:hypothetical protein